MPTLLCYAAPAEAGPLANEPAPQPHGLLELGVGKAPAAVTLASELTRRAAANALPDLVLLFGVAGSYPGGPEVLDLCLCSVDRLLDEGVQTPGAFLSLESLGLSAAAPVPMDETHGQRIAQALDIPLVPAATVSTCSGTDALATMRTEQGGPQLESMEGAAVALCCQRAGVPMVQLRAVSNRCGNRDEAGWDLPGACAKVQGAVRRLLQEGLLP